MSDIDKAIRLVDAVDEHIKKWTIWFPNPRSEVEVPREDLIALIEIARPAIESARSQTGTNKELP